MHPLHRRIEAEYGEPFWDVVRGYASQGCSRSETARLLGYSDPAAFLKLLLRHPEIAIDWPSPFHCESHRAVQELAATPGTALNASRRAGGRQSYMVRSEVRWITLDGIRAPVTHHMRRLGSPVTLRSVTRRLDKGWPPRMAVVSPCTRHPNTGQKGHQNHPWKEGRHVV